MAARCVVLTVCNFHFLIETASALLRGNSLSLSCDTLLSGSVSSDAKIIPGLFDVSDDPAQIPSKFGLIDSWENLKTTVSQLNTSAPKGTSYKVFFIGRHGQGYHNVAETLYGSMEWNGKKAKLDGDGNMTWGPDPELTELGVHQAQTAHAAWITEIARGAPLPQSLYFSPLTRAIHTALITFDGILINTPGCPRPLIKEKLREMNGIHTCDKRSPRAHIAKAFPQCDIEPGFTEEDELWREDHRETEEELTVRLREAIDDIVTHDPAEYLSITAHGGACRAIMRVVGIKPFELKTGGVAAFIAKITRTRSESGIA